MPSVVLSAHGLLSLVLLDTVEVKVFLKKARHILHAYAEGFIWFGQSSVDIARVEPVRAQGSMYDPDSSTMSASVSVCR